MPPVRGIVEVFQKVRAWFFDTPELDLDPASVKDQYISNIWRRTITYLWGVRNGVSVPVTVGPGGSLRVETYGSGFTAYETKTATTTNDPTANDFQPTFGTAHRWDILVETNDIKVRFYKPDGVTFYGDIPLVTGFYSIPFSSLGCQFDSRVDGSHGVYHVSAFA